MSDRAYDSLLRELRATRRGQGLTQAQVARGIKLSRAQYTAIERGRSMLNWSHLRRLARFLKRDWVIRA
jgi:transcriptional regulator with XRE-family HTH domain